MASIQCHDSCMVSKWYKFLNYNHAGLFNTQNFTIPTNPANLMTGVMLQRKFNIMENKQYSKSAWVLYNQKLTKTKQHCNHGDDMNTEYITQT